METTSNSVNTENNQPVEDKNVVFPIFCRNQCGFYCLLSFSDVIKVMDEPFDRGIIIRKDPGRMKNMSFQYLEYSRGNMQVITSADFDKATVEMLQRMKSLLEIPKADE